MPRMDLADFGNGLPAWACRVVARGVSDALTACVRRAVDVQSIADESSELAESVELEPTCRFTVPADWPRLTVWFSPSLAEALLDLLLGGDGQACKPRGPLTALDRQLLGPLVEQIAGLASPESLVSHLPADDETASCVVSLQVRLAGGAIAFSRSMGVPPVPVVAHNENTFSLPGLHGLEAHATHGRDARATENRLLLDRVDFGVDHLIDFQGDQAAGGAHVDFVAGDVHVGVAVVPVLVDEEFAGGDGGGGGVEGEAVPPPFFCGGGGGGHLDGAVHKGIVEDGGGDAVFECCRMLSNAVGGCRRF